MWWATFCFGLHWISHRIDPTRFGFEPVSTVTRRLVHRFPYRAAKFDLRFLSFTARVRTRPVFLLKGNRSGDVSGGVETDVAVPMDVSRCGMAKLEVRVSRAMAHVKRCCAPPGRRWEVLAGTWCASWLLAGPGAALTAENLLYLEAWRAVDRAYVDAPKLGSSWRQERDRTLKQARMATRDDTYAAIRSSLATLGDPFTRVVEPKRYEAMRRASRQSTVAGVGVQLAAQKQGEAVVVKTNRGGPAERAGMAPGDAVLAVDGRDVSDMPLADVGDLLRGEPGSEAVLLVRSGSKEKTLKLVRAVVDLQPVEEMACPGNTLAYVHIGAFQNDPSARDAMRKAIKEGAQGLVVDLRGNTGGSFPAGVELARDLLGAGEIVRVADAQGVRDILDADFPHPLVVPASVPITLLVDKGTASAAEVFAAALHDNDRASIVGDSTYGKARVQTIVELSDGGAVLVSTAKYLTPAGEDIQGVGIVPDKSLPMDLPEEPQAFCKAVKGLPASELFVRQNVPRFPEDLLL